MAWRVTSFEPTPNPNALKCVLDRAILGEDEGPRSYRKAEEAAGDALAESLFAIEPEGSVACVLISTDWITVNRAPGADWERVKQGVRDVLARAE